MLPIACDPSPGFFGKLPSHGDFITRRVPAALLASWEAWLEAGLQHSREHLGDRWLETYVSSPIWSFCGSAACCGDRPFCGVLMPSMDRIGRYYPLSILARLCARDSPFDIATRATGWFDHMEVLALSCLREGFDFAIFDAELAAASLPLGGATAEAPQEMSCPPETHRAREFGSLLNRLLQDTSAGYSLWWTSGSQTIAACSRAYLGLPPMEEFCKFLG
jgi:type VI secretion system protein ImpM